MSIIYTYPTVTPSSDDLILLTDTSDSSKATKTATVASMLSAAAQGILTVKRTLSIVEVRDLHNIPIELIAAPGVGKALQVLHVSAFLDFATTPYPNTVYIAFRYAGMGAAGMNVQLATAFTTAATDSYRTAGGGAGGVLTDNWAINTAFTVYTNGATGAGDSPVNVYITYKIIDI